MASLVTEIRRRARWVIPQLLGIGLVAYFCFHLLQGDRGLRTYLRLQEDLAAAEATAARLTLEVAAARAQVAQLSSGSLDLDRLEEQAQAVISYFRPGDYVIFIEQ
jgi:cell division protein FtsB